MAQFLRPNSDISNVWSKSTGTDGFALVDETTPSDADYVFTPDQANLDHQFGMTSPLATPSAGTCTVRFRESQADGGVPASSGGNPSSIEVEVVENAIIVASSGVITTTEGGWTTRSFTFSTTLISNWDNVEVHLLSTGSGGPTASRRGVAVSWVEMEVPDAGATTYDESVSISSSNGVALNTNVNFFANTTVSSNTTIQEGGNSIMDSSFSISSIVQMLQSGGLNFNDGISLQSQASLLANMSLVINGNVVILSNSTIDTSNNANVENFIAIASAPAILIENVANIDANTTLQSLISILQSAGSDFSDTISLGSVSNISQNINIELESNINLDSSSAISQTVNLDINATLSLLTNALLQTLLEGGVYNESILLDATTNISSVLEAVLGASISLGGNVSINAGNNAILGNNIIMSMSGSLDTVGGNDFNVTITLQSVGSMFQSAEIGVKDIVIINVKVPVGKYRDNEIVGSYYIVELKNGIILQKEKDGLYLSNEDKKGKLKDY